MSVTPISDEERERALQSVGEELQRYPISLLQHNLKAVFVVETVNFSGVAAEMIFP